MDTSQQAWQEIQATLPKSRAEILDVMRYVGVPLTARELRRLMHNNGYRFWEHCWKRMSELERLGRVRRCGKKKCDVTGKLAVLWGLAS